jgi:hypothetical protein
VTNSVRNNRKERPVTDQATGITFRGTVTVSDEQMAKLRENPVVAAMLGFDSAGEPQGTPLLAVERLAPERAAAKPAKGRAD